MKSTQEIVEAIASGEVGAAELTNMVKESVQGMAVAEVLAERNAIYESLGFGLKVEDDISDLVNEEEESEEEDKEEDKEEKESDDSDEEDEEEDKEEDDE